METQVTIINKTNTIYLFIYLFIYFYLFIYLFIYFKGNHIGRLVSNDVLFSANAMLHYVIKNMVKVVIHVNMIINIEHLKYYSSI